MRALRRLGGMVPQGDLKRGRLGKILQRPSDWRICSRHLEGEAVSGGVEKGSMVKEDFVCRAVGYTGQSCNVVPTKAVHIFVPSQHLIQKVLHFVCEFRESRTLKCLDSGSRYPGP